MKLSRFEKAYFIFISVCIALSVIFLVYVGIVVSDYDKAQPERTVEKQLHLLGNMAEDGTLAEELDFRAACVNRFEENDVDALLTSYTRKLTSGKLTYEYRAAESNDLTKVYSVLADGKLVGRLTLSGENARTSLFFFTMADWTVEEFVPYPVETVYNLEIYCPEEVNVSVNGVQPTGEELAGGTEVPVYKLDGLLSEPQIVFTRADGTELHYITDGNTVKPAVYEYSFILPEDISVSLDGAPLSGKAEADGLLYTIRDMTKPDVLFIDKCGDVIRYDGSVPAEELYTHHSLAVPQDFSVKVNGVSADDIASPQNSAHPDADALFAQSGVRLPDMKTYEFVLISGDSEAEITDNAGNVTTHSLSEGSVWLNGSGVSEIPSDIAEEIDVMEAAKCWSKFMTDDLGGYWHGLDEVRKYLLATSAYYDYAAEWATGIDITFTSVHTLDSFENERISDVTVYSDNCFSCHIYFEKNMTLYRDGNHAGERTDIFNSIVYFVYADDTPDNGVDDPHWAIAVMHDVL